MSRFDGPLESELKGEAAAALGLSARSLRRKLDLLRAFAPMSSAELSSVHRERLVADAAEALWGFVVQRETLGMYDTEHVIRTYEIPPEVWKRMGVRKR